MPPPVRNRRESHADIRARACMRATRQARGRVACERRGRRVGMRKGGGTCHSYRGWSLEQIDDAAAAAAIKRRVVDDPKHHMS